MCHPATDPDTPDELSTALKIRHHAMHVGAEVPGALGVVDDENVEEGANAQTWLFGGHSMMVRLWEGCVGPSNPRTHAYAGPGLGLGLGVGVGVGVGVGLRLGC